MKLKEQKKLGTLYFVLGAVLAIAGYFIKKQLACIVWRRRLRAWACPTAARSPAQP